MNEEADTYLVERIRKLTKRRKGHSEQRMFGGICIMINGNICLGSWTGSLIVWLDRANHAESQADPHVQSMNITGKVMRDWALFEPEGTEHDSDLKIRVDRGITFARTLEPKAPK